MSNITRILATMMIMIGLLAGAMIPSIPVFADSPDNCWRVIGTYNPPTVTEHEGEYMLSDSPFRYDEVNYIFTPVYYMSGAMEYLGEGMVYPILMGEPIPLDGTQDIDVGVYSFLYVGDPPMTFHATVYYPNGNKSDVDAFWEELSGTGNWSCDSYFEGVFVNESGAYTYHAPTPVCVPEPTPTFAPEDTIEEIIIPDFNESSPWIWSATALNQTDAEGDLCGEWESIWNEGMLMAGMPQYNVVASASMTGVSMIARHLMAFNTSDIPDDAIITGAYLRIVPYMWAQMFNYENTGVRIGGTYNSSIFPIEYLGGVPLPIGNYSEDEFYGNFGRFDFVDMPISMMTYNFNESLYYDVWLNASGVDYINPEGLTVLTLRVEEDADFDCPQSELNMTLSEVAVWSGNLSGEEPTPHSMLVVGWHIPTEPTPTPDACWDVVSGMVDPPTLTHGEGFWQLSRSAFRYDDIDWDGGRGFTYFWTEGAIMVETGEGSSWIEPDGTAQIDVGLYEINGEGGWQYYTIYYINGDKAEMEAFLDYYEYDWVCSAYHEGVFVGNGSAYTYHQPCTEEEPIIPVGPVSAVLIILGLVFTVLGLLGIMAVLFKGESLMLSVKVGVLVGLSIFAIIGIMIIESIIVSLTGG